MPKNSNHLSTTDDKINPAPFLPKRCGILGLAILGLSFLIFGNSIQSDFIYDDQIVLSHSLFNQPGQFFKFFGEPYFEDFIKAGLYRPLTQISFSLNFALGGANPAGFHIFNIFLHGLNSFLVFIFVKNWFKSSKLGILVSLLFLVLPIHSEVAASIVGRAELLAFFFAVLSLIFWGRSRYLLAAVFLFCGLLSKETAIAVPLIIAVKTLYDRSLVRAPDKSDLSVRDSAPRNPVSRGAMAVKPLGSTILWKKFLFLPARSKMQNLILHFVRVKQKGLNTPLLAEVSRGEASEYPAACREGYSYLAGVVGAYFWLRVYVLGEYAFKSNVEFIFNPLAFSSVSERLATAFKVLALYVKKIFIPHLSTGLIPLWKDAGFLPYNLSPDYSFNQIIIEKSIFSSIPSFLGFLFLSTSLVALVYFLKKGKFYGLVMALALFILPYLLVSNLFFPIGTIMADRLMYMPSLGIVILSGWMFLKFYERKKLRLITNILFSIAIFVYAFTAFQQNKIWANEEIFFKSMYERSPDSVVAKTNWARLIYGREPEKGKELAFSAYAQYQDFVPLLNLLAVIEKEEGRPNEAVKYLERAYQLRPHHQETLVGLSRLYFALGEYQKAEPVLETLIFEYGGSGNVILHIIVNIRIGNYKEALVILDKNAEIIDTESLETLSEYAVLKMSKNSSPTLLKKAEEKITKLEGFFLY